MAKVLLPDSNTIELVSVLELDPHGTSDPNAAFPLSASDGLGVRRGDFVLVHPDSATNGFKKPAVPTIGEVEHWVRENPVVGGQLGWRKEMADIGAAIATRRATEGFQETFKMIHLAEGSGMSTWIGEVTEVCRITDSQDTFRTPASLARARWIDRGDTSRFHGSFLSTRTVD